MYVVQGNGGYLQQQQQQQQAVQAQWLAAAPPALYRGGAPQAQNTAPVYQQQQVQQQVMVPHQSNPAERQVVYLNVGGTLQRGIVQNGAVYLLANEVGNNAGQQQQQQAVAMQHQAPVMVQQVLSNGQLVPVSGAYVASHGPVQLPTAQQLQLQPQQAQLQARPMPAVQTMALNQPQMQAQQQQQQVMMMNCMAAGRAAPAVNTAAMGVQARPHQPQVVLQLPQAAQPRAGIAATPASAGPALLNTLGVAGAMGPATQRPGLAPTGQLPSNAVSANTASLMPRMVGPGSTAAGTTAAPAAAARVGPHAASQPMTIAATLAALPRNPAAPAAAAAGPAPGAPAAAPGGSDLSSPVAPPGTPGMGSMPVAGSAAAIGTIGAVISKLAAPDVGAGGGNANATTTIISGPSAASLTPAGASFLASQPGTPSRSNSVGNHSSSSSSGASREGDVEGKEAVMRMFARSFMETGIGLDQALGMIQPADREMLAAAFAAEAAAALATHEQQQQPAGGAGAAKHDAADASRGGVLDLGGEQISMPPSQGRAPGSSELRKMSNAGVGGAWNGGGNPGGDQDGFGLGSWGFSLFSQVGSDQAAGGGFGGIAGQATAASTAPAAAPAGAAATLFANLHT